MKFLKWENRSALGLIIVFVLAIITLTIAGMFFKKNEETLWENQAIQHLKNLSDFKVRQTQLWKTDIITDSKEMAGSPLLTKTILSWLIRKDAKEKELIRDNFLSILKYKRDHSAMSLTNTSGKTLIYVSDRSTGRHSVKDIADRAVKARKEVIGDFYKESPGNSIFIDIAIPVFNTHKNIAAVLVFQVNPQVNLFSTLNRWPDYNSSEEFPLFERKGDSVLFISKLAQHPRSTLSYYIPLADTANPVVKSVIHGPGTYQGIGYHHQKVIEVINRIKGSPWYLAAKIDKGEFYAPVNAKLRILSWSLIGGFLFLFAILFLIIQQMRHNFYKEILEEERKQNALKSHYEYVVKYANDIILMEDDYLNIVDANQRAVETYQYSLEELLKKKKTDLIAPEAKNEAEKRLRSLDENDGYLVETIHQRKDGTLFNVEISSRAIYVDGKKFLHQVIRDTTERKRAEKALAESEERFRTTLYSTGDAIITTDTEGKVRYLNKVAERLVGWPENEAAGRQVNDVFRVFSEDTNEELENPVEKVLREGKILFLSNHTNLITKDGKQIPVGDSGAPIKDSDGNITGAVLVFRDLRKERAARKALEDSELHYRIVTDSAPVGIFRTLADGHTATYVNPTWCRITGLKAEQALGDGWLSAIYPEDREIVGSGWKQSASDNNEGSDKEYRYLRHDGSIAYVVGHKAPVINSEGEITGYVGTITDITELKEIENQLTLFRTLIDASNDAVEIVDPDTGTFLDINRSGSEALGYTREEMLSKTIYDIDPVVTVELFEEVKKEIRKTGKKIWEGIHKRKDGTTFPVEVSIQTVKLDREYIISLSRDITERKKAEESLRESEEKFRSIYENSVVGIYRTTPDGKILFCNKKLVQILGFDTFEELAKRNLNQEGYKNKDTRIAFKKLLEQNGVFEGLESEWVKKDGSTVIISESARLIRDENGKPLYYDGVALDITDRKRAEETLLKLSKAVDQSPASIIITDINGIIEYVNPKFTENTSYKYQEVVGRHFDFLKSGYLSKKQITDLWKNIMSGNGWQGEFRTKKKNGTPYWEQVSISSIKNSAGKITHFVEVGVDITERKEKDKALRRAMEKAQESDRLKTAFLMNMSHEIRTPMNGIIGFISLLNEPGITEEERAGFIKTVTKSGERLMNTINDIIEISKIEIGDINLKYETVNIADLMQYYLDFFTSQAKDKGLSLTISKQLKGDMALIKTDRQKLDSIMMNLLKNAIKFTNNGGIEIGNSRENGSLRFYVKDSGRGIPKDMQDSIFDRFMQAEIGLSRGYEGSGIGLSIVKAYVEALKGDIEIESEVGKGSTFTVTIPYQPGA